MVNPSPLLSILRAVEAGADRDRLARLLWIRQSTLSAIVRDLEAGPDERKEAALADLWAGMPVGDVATKYGRSAQWVYALYREATGRDGRHARRTQA